MCGRQLLEEDGSADDDFWQQEFFAEERRDEEYEESTEEEDVPDADFSESVSPQTRHQQQPWQYFHCIVSCKALAGG